MITGEGSPGVSRSHPGANEAIPNEIGAYVIRSGKCGLWKYAAWTIAVPLAVSCLIETAWQDAVESVYHGGMVILIIGIITTIARGFREWRHETREYKLRKMEASRSIILQSPPDLPKSDNKEGSADPGTSTEGGEA